MPLGGIQIEFSVPLKLCATLMPDTNPMIVERIRGKVQRVLVQFDEGSEVLQQTPLVLTLPNNGNHNIDLHYLLNWIRHIYISLWSIDALSWSHRVQDAMMLGIFKNRGSDTWRVAFDFWKWCLCHSAIYRIKRMMLAHQLGRLTFWTFPGGFIWLCLSMYARIWLASIRKWSSNSRATRYL